MTVRTSFEVKSGGWPNNVGVVREVHLSNDLATITQRRVTAIKVYDKNDAFLTLSLSDAKTLGDRLAEAITAAESGPIGDLVEEMPTESTTGETRDLPTPGATT